MLANDVYNFEALVAEESRLRIVDGQVGLSERPGIGIEFDEDAVARYKLARDQPGVDYGP